MTIVSQSEYATLRAVSRKTITQWKKDGKLVLRDGGVDVEATDEYLHKYRAAGVTGNKAGNKLGNTVPVEIRDDETPQEAAQRIIRVNGADMTIEEAKRAF